jgi:hypothetical protein
MHQQCSKSATRGSTSRNGRHDRNLSGRLHVAHPAAGRAAQSLDDLGRRRRWLPAACAAHHDSAVRDRHAGRDVWATRQSHLLDRDDRSPTFDEPARRRRSAAHALQQYARCAILGAAQIAFVVHAPVVGWVFAGLAALAAAVALAGFCFGCFLFYQFKLNRARLFCSTTR